ncbi:Cof-type HAD-IIB family hydrolase [Rhodoblastus sp.]|uniref:Cof-type HAD-IIB family hydrolase n=1 Tax=Rhodoblastus sp. TaxID=1962975 RepID=UPI003F9CBD99
MIAPSPASSQGFSLVLADVDGTLVTPRKTLTARAIGAVKALNEAGIAFAITSGRPPRGMAMLVDPLTLRTPIAGFNGGVFTHPDLTVIMSRSLDPTAARTSTDLLLDKGLDVWVYTQDEWLIRDRKAPHVARETATVKFAATVVSGFNSEHFVDAVKIVGVSDDLDLVAACETEARKALVDKASVARSQPYYLDITHPSANKGAVATELSSFLKIPLEKIVAIGDMPNDVLMFRKVGFSIAMGNASDEVKAQASAVTDSNEADGFAKAMRRFVLGQSEQDENAAAISRSNHAGVSSRRRA